VAFDVCLRGFANVYFSRFHIIIYVVFSRRAVRGALNGARASPGLQFRRFARMRLRARRTRVLAPSWVENA
jgi:hypothetical protein